MAPKPLKKKFKAEPTSRSERVDIVDEIVGTPRNKKQVTNMFQTPKGQGIPTFSPASGMKQGIIGSVLNYASPYIFRK